MSNLTILLHPVSDQDTSVSQLVLWGPGVPAETNVLYHPIPSDTISGLDAGHMHDFQQEDGQAFDSGLASLAAVATSDRQEVIVLHDEFMQSSLADSYPSTFSSLSNAFGNEGQMPAPPPPSPNDSTRSTSPPSENKSLSTFKITSSSLYDALGQDWLSSPLRLPFSSPSTPESQPVMFIAPTPSTTSIHPSSYFEMSHHSFLDAGGNHSLPAVEFIFPRIEEKNENNHLSHHNGGDRICYYSLGVEQTDIDIRRQGERTVTSKKPEIRVESAISRKRKRDEDLETPVVKPPKFKNQGRRSDLEGFRPPKVNKDVEGAINKDVEGVINKDVEGVVEKVETVVKKDIEGVVNKDVVKVIGKDRKRRAVSDRTLRELERQEEIARHRAKKRRSGARA